MTSILHFVSLQAAARSHTAPLPRAAKLRLALAWPLLAAALLLGGPPAAFAQAGDPPGRVARLNLVEGEVSFAPADSGGETGWTPAVLNRPLTEGDRIWTAPRSRSELHIGATTLRLSEQTSVDFLALDDNETQLRLAQGTLQLRVRNVYEGQRLEVNTPNLAFVITEAGDYRVDAHPADNSTRVVVNAGRGTAYGDGGTAMDLDRGQQATFSGTQLAAGGPPPSPDGFDSWAASRDQLEERSVAARYVPREVVGYQQLDAYGDWQQDPAYGAVWLPRAVPSGWAPYRAGHWSWISPWGWTWIDDAPWGFAPFHYGRWAQIGPRWGWVPGRIAPRPVYAPALVAFIGGHGGGASWNVAIGPDRRSQPAFGWFPLAPGEAFRPGYRVSPRYVSSVNQNLSVNRLAGDDARGHRYQRHPDAVSVARADDFSRGRGAIRASTQLVQAAELGRARVAVEAGAMPPRPERPRDRGDVNPPRPPAASALPPPAVTSRPVVASEFGRDRTRPSDPGARRNPEAGQPGAPVRDAGRGSPQAEPDKRQSGERRQAELARIAQPPLQGMPPPQPVQQADDGRGRRSAPSAEQPAPAARPPAADPPPSPRQAREKQPPAQPEQRNQPQQMQRQQPITRQADQERQEQQRAQQAQQRAQQQQQQQQMTRQADQERQEQQRAQQAQQAQHQQMQRQQQMTRQADQERQEQQRTQQIQRQAQQQAQRNAQQQQQEQARRQLAQARQQPTARPPPAQPSVQPPGQARQHQPDQRGDQRKEQRGDERRQRGAPGWEQR